MRYLADTDWLIDYLRGNEPVASLLAQLLSDGIGISIISIAEIYEGMDSTSRQAEAEQALRNLLTYAWVIPIKEPVCRVFAHERRRLRSEGKLIGDFDLLIGATALHHQLTLLTTNRRHFKRLEGLNIISASG